MQNLDLEGTVRVFGKEVIRRFGELLPGGPQSSSPTRCGREVSMRDRRRQSRAQRAPRKFARQAFGALTQLGRQPGHIDERLDVAFAGGALESNRERQRRISRRRKSNPALILRGSPRKQNRSTTAARIRQQSATSFAIHETFKRLLGPDYGRSTPRAPSYLWETYDRPVSAGAAIFRRLRPRLRLDECQNIRIDRFRFCGWHAVRKSFVGL